MILEESEVLERYQSPLNLLHRLHEGTGGKVRIPCIPDSNDIIDDLDEKLKHGTLKTKAAAVMNMCLDELKDNVDKIKTERLADVADKMNKIITAQEENRKDAVNAPQVIVYAPQFLTEEHFETIYVKE